MIINRRTFLNVGIGLSSLPFALRAFGSDALTEAPQQRLIVLFLRGGLDGLFAFSPVDDPQFGSLRPTLSQTVLQSGIRLKQTGFAAHPSCHILADWFNRGELNFAPCAGTTDNSRSHFQAQDIFELGTGKTFGDTGFMARAANLLANDNSSVSFTSEVPLCFQGSDAAIIPLSGESLKLPTGSLLDAIQQSHQNTNIGTAIDQSITTENLLENVLGMEVTAAKSASPVNHFSKTATQMAKLLRSNPNLTLAFADLGGWDTHAYEDNTLSSALLSLNQGIATLREQLGDEAWRNTRLIITSEFGRTVAENGTRGTDHGHGGLFIITGGAVTGGKMLGDFPGLLPRHLNQHRDLPVRYDWRSLIAAHMRHVYDFSDNDLDTIFPDRPKRSARS